MASQKTFSLWNVSETKAEDKTTASKDLLQGFSPAQLSLLTALLFLHTSMTYAYQYNHTVRMPATA